MNISNTYTCRSRQRGISMIELMIAMLLGLFLMAGVLQLFSSNKATFGNMEGISEIQDGARAGIERMRSRVRMAGYMGCSNTNVLNPNNMTAGVANVAFGPNVMITGADNDATDPNIVDGTDSVTVVFATAANTELNANMTSRTDNIVITSNPNNFRMDDALIISDCENADVFGISNFTGTGPYTIAHALNDQNGDQVNSSTSLAKPYLANNSLIMSLSNATYSVQNTNPLRTDDAGNPVTALFETRGGTSTEIVSGVEDMQIVYGVDTDASADGEADLYQSAAAMAAAQWARVVSVRIALLIATERGVGRDVDVRPYNFLTDTAGIAGAAQTGDRHMRRSFTTTIGLRNRSS